MTSPKFAPRDYCLSPQQFGREARVKWVPFTPAPDATGNVRRELPEEERVFFTQLGAAQAQHYFAYRILERLDMLDMTIPTFAQRSGQDQTRLYRVLRGKVLMRLEDIALAHYVLKEVWEVLADEGNGLA